MGKQITTEANANVIVLQSRMNRLSFWVAIFTVVIAALHMVIGVMTPPRSGPLAKPSDIIPYPYTDVASYVPIDYLWLYPGSVLAIVFVLLIACIHHYSDQRQKVLTHTALIFSGAYAVVILVDYFIQLAVIQPSLVSGEKEGLSLFTQYNPHGVFIALESLGYFLMSLSLGLAAFVFKTGRLEKAIRWLFILDFALAVIAGIGLLVVRFDIVAFEVAILSINWFVLISAGILLSILFRRTSLVDKGQKGVEITNR